MPLRSGETRPWLSFAARQAGAPPLRFVCGFRHTIRKGPSCKTHSHRALEIVYHPRGRGVTRLGDGRAVAFADHAAIVYGPGVPHDQAMATEGEDLCVQITVPRREAARLRGVVHVPRVTDPVLVEELAALAESPVPEEKAARAVLDFRATAVLLALLRGCGAGAGTPAPPAIETHVRKAEAYLRRHYAAIESLQEVADHAGISLDHLRHLFRRVRRTSLLRFLHLLRIGRAKFLLRNTGLPLKEIAPLAGFRNEYYFSTLFKRYVGSPPARYRKRK